MRQQPKFKLASELLVAAIIILLAVVIGYCIGYVPQAIGVGLALIIMLQWRNRWRYTKWLQNATHDTIPNQVNSWHELYQRYYWLQQSQQQTERTYKKFLVQYRRTMAAMTDGVIFLDQDDRILWFNAAAMQMLGLDEKRDTYQRIERLIRHAELPAFLGNNEANTSIEINAPDEQRVLALSVLDYGSRERYILVRDVTSQKRSEQIRRDFVANASHELRTPLTVIRGYAEVLTEDYPTSSQEYEAFSNITQQSVRMQRILDNMLQLARLESINGSDLDESLDIREMLQNAMDEAAVLAEQYEQVLQLDVMENWLLRGFRQDIHSIIQNLLINAIRYSGEGSTIRLEWTADEEEAELTISDNGVGIAATHLHRLTERFYRVDNNRDANTGGTGLGLAIVKHVLENHQAHMLIDSVEGLGTTFRCVFPRSRVIKRQKLNAG